jgi:hypothetical protein
VLEKPRLVDQCPVSVATTINLVAVFNDRSDRLRESPTTVFDIVIDALNRFLVECDRLCDWSNQGCWSPRTRACAASF